jgi:hypothetical protein
MLQKITNKKVAEILFNAGIEKAIYRNARTQLPNNNGYRFQTFKNEYHNMLTIYAAATSWTNVTKEAELIQQIATALTAAGVAFEKGTNNNIFIHRA